MEDYIDTRHTDREYEHMTRRVFDSSDVSEGNKILLRRFLRDCQLGKTNPVGSRKRVGKARQSALLGRLLVPLLYWKKDLSAVTQEDMEEFIMALETGKIVSRATGRTHSPAYQANIKGALKKFYKWLWGDSRSFPSVVEWIDAREPGKETVALTEAEVERLIDGARTLRDKAFIQVLYDSGMRLGEVLNVRLKHVWQRTYDLNGDRATCFFVRVPYSKTFKRTIATPMPETTKWLSYWLEWHPSRPSIGEDGKLSATNEGAPLFPMSANCSRHLLKKLGQRMLEKRVYPHLLRHSSATYWANQRSLSYVQYCTRFGWSPNSPIPKRYIYQEGLETEEPAKRFLASMADNNDHSVHAQAPMLRTGPIGGPHPAPTLGVSSPRTSASPVGTTSQAGGGVSWPSGGGA